jgi:hypothetical protein
VGGVTADQFFLNAMTHWDHIKAWLKNFNVSDLRTDDEIEAEIKLCQVLCPFCHSIKTYFFRDNVAPSLLPYAVMPYHDAATTNVPPPLPEGFGGGQRPQTTNVGRQRNRADGDGRDMPKRRPKSKNRTKKAGLGMPKDPADYEDDGDDDNDKVALADDDGCEVADDGGGTSATSSRRERPKRTRSGQQKGLSYCEDSGSSAADDEGEDAGAGAAGYNKDKEQEYEFDE